MDITTDGLISWTPQWGTETSGIVNVWVSDGNESYDLQAFTLNVSQVDLLSIYVTIYLFLILTHLF